MHISMEDRILAALRLVVDPESGVNIVDLGLVYAVGVLPGGDVYVQTTLTKPASPVNAGLADEAEDAVRRAFAGGGPHCQDTKSKVSKLQSLLSDRDMRLWWIDMHRAPCPV